LRSYVFQNKKKYRFDLEDLKRKLVCEHYERFPDFRRKVLDKAVVEINKYTDIEIQWQPVTKARKVVEIEFVIKHRDIWDRSIAMNRANEAIETKKTVNRNKTKEDQIEGQMTIYDFVK
jgi:plasmid replication initiation protein